MSIDFRAIILQRLKQLGKSRYWLAETIQDNPSRASVYAYLRGEQEMKSANLARILEVLGIQIVIPPENLHTQKGKRKDLPS